MPRLTRARSLNSPMPMPMSLVPPMMGTMLNSCWSPLVHAAWGDAVVWSLELSGLAACAWPGEKAVKAAIAQASPRLRRRAPPGPPAHRPARVETPTLDASMSPLVMYRPRPNQLVAVRYKSDSLAMSRPTPPRKAARRARDGKDEAPAPAAGAGPLPLAG